MTDARISYDYSALKGSLAGLTTFAEILLQSRRDEDLKQPVLKPS